MDRSPHETERDLDLARRIAAGDRGALGRLYELHFDSLYDLAYRSLRDADAAADAVQDAFVKAWDALRAGKIPENPKAWLYAIARNSAIDEHRRRARIATPTPSDDDEDLLSVLPAASSDDPETAAMEHETAELVWAAAEALTPPEYTLLDLHVRRGMEADDLAGALGLRKGAVYTRLSRLKDSLEDSVTSNLLMRQGSRDCPTLAQIVSESGATHLTRELRRAIHDHAKDCAICEQTRRRLVSPVAMFGSLGLVPAPLFLRRRTWERVSSETAKERRRPRRRLRYGAAALAALALIGGGVAIAARRPGVAPPKDPPDVHSTSHRIGVASADRVIVMAWTPRRGAAAYSVSWTHASNDEPDAIRDMSGSANGTASATLDAGTWWFHLRTENRDRRWTHTVHRGPFVLIAGATLPAPSAAASPSPTRSSSLPQRPAAPTKTTSPSPHPSSHTPTPHPSTHTPAPYPSSNTPTPQPSSPPPTTQSPSPTPSQPTYSSSPSPTPTH